MDIRDIAVSSSDKLYVAAGGFSPHSRDGLISVLEPSASNTTLFEMSVLAVGVDGPTVALDQAAKVLYSNAVVMASGDPSGAPYRIPFLRLERP
jgi:hypothetical protein